MIHFQGIRVFPKGTKIYRQDFPSPEAQAARLEHEILKAPYIVEAHNPHFRRSIMLAYDFEGVAPRAFSFETLDVLSDADGDSYWLHRTPEGLSRGEKLTEDEKVKLEETEYRIIDGNDAFVFLEEAAREEPTPLYFRDAMGQPGESEHGWNAALKMMVRDGIRVLLEEKWFRRDKNLSEKITRFIETQKEQAAAFPEAFRMPSVESQPKVFELEARTSR